MLEVIAAVSILAVCGLTLLTMQAESIRAVERARVAEGQVIAANAFLNAVALWSRDDLDRHLGKRPQGPWLMYADRVLPELYRVVLTDTINNRVVLQTELFRPRASGESQ